jgi:hypothetical protein
MQAERKTDRPLSSPPGLVDRYPDSTNNSVRSLLASSVPACMASKQASKQAVRLSGWQMCWCAGALVVLVLMLVNKLPTHRGESERPALCGREELILY